MGLDMYISNKEGSEIAYWRKEPAIHDWFEGLAMNKGIEFDEFNCIPVPVTKLELEMLIDDLKEKRLSYDASGFFFGSNLEDANSEEWHNEQIKTIRNIISIMEDDEEVIYDSWW
jgi:hypothetical protein